MADIWVMGRSARRGSAGQLVRADAITHVMASDEKLSVTKIESEQVVTLVHKDAERGTVLPENFHLALLVKLAEARAQAHNSDEDLILFADLDDNRQWGWSVFTASELWQP